MMDIEVLEGILNADYQVPCGAKPGIEILVGHQSQRLSFGLI
jgi:hypothetical protein